MNRRVTAVILAVLLALVGTAAVTAYVRHADQRALAGQQAERVYVAQKLVPAGTTFQAAVDQGLITEEQVAAKAVPSNPLATVSPSTAGDVAVSDIQPGELVLAPRFGTQSSAPSVLPIPAGDIAISVLLQDPARVGSFVVAGSDIAIFDTFNVRSTVKGAAVPSGDHLTDSFLVLRATRLLLPRVRVLAVGATTTSGTQSPQTTGETGGNQTPNPQTGQLVTVAVTQAQAEALVQGIQTGTLYLGLLTDSSQTAVGTGVTDLTLFQAR